MRACRQCQSVVDQLIDRSVDVTLIPHPLLPIIPLTAPQPIYSHINHTKPVAPGPKSFSSHLPNSSTSFPSMSVSGRPHLRFLRPLVIDAHKMTQQPAPSPFSNVSRAARVAASKTSSTPSPLNDEHSRYLRAPISWAIDSPCRSVTNRRLFFRISSTATGSSRKSFFSPTRMIGTPGHRSAASSIHCDLGRG